MQMTDMWKRIYVNLESDLHGSTREEGCYKHYIYILLSSSAASKSGQNVEVPVWSGWWFQAGSLNLSHLSSVVTIAFRICTRLDHLMCTLLDHRMQ